MADFQSLISKVHFFAMFFSARLSSFWNSGDVSVIISSKGNFPVRRLAMMRTGLDMRTSAGDMCELDLGDTRHQCRLDSISSSGAQVNCLGFLQETRRGDKTVLHLPTETNAIACRVTHIDAAKIQLRFEK